MWSFTPTLKEILDDSCDLYKFRVPLEALRLQGRGWFRVPLKLPSEHRLVRKFNKTESRRHARALTQDKMDREMWQAKSCEIRTRHASKWSSLGHVLKSPRSILNHLRGLGRTISRFLPAATTELCYISNPALLVHAQHCYNRTSEPSLLLWRTWKAYTCIEAARSDLSSVIETVKRVILR